MCYKYFAEEFSKNNENHVDEIAISISCATDFSLLFVCLFVWFLPSSAIYLNLLFIYLYLNLF